MKRTLLITTLILVAVTILPFCTRDDKTDPEPEPLKTQVRVQVAYDATDVAFRFVWKSQKKLYPAGSANVGLNYPGHYHDMLKHNGTNFDRLASGTRMEEDRVSVMIDKYEGGIAGFAKSGCAIICHSGMDSHHLLTDDVLDHWHWRGARSGPMGYAEDVAINQTERIRDNATVASKFIRSGGDRLRENQAAMTGSAHPVLTDGFPRFVFNKGKNMGGGYTVPSFFLADVSNSIVSDPHMGLPLVRDLEANRSLLVVYQDKTFDPTDKINSLDLGYLVWVATGELGHLPAHLQDEGNAEFTFWKNFWATETAITAAAAALTKLNEVHQEWTNSSKNAMVTRSVGFIYASDQHDVTSERSFNASTNEWTVVLKRKLVTGSNRDADLSGLPNGTKYAFSFAMHDSGAGSETHDISVPYSLGKDDGSDVKAASVANINTVDWSKAPMLDTYWVKQSFMTKYTYDWLISGAHPGAAAMSSTSCQTCHTADKSLLTDAVIN